ncbi:hypothetical protein R1flu_017860 [Riccia fluitans]|uniref:Uncharacterized protein n=1 Tax=Riccia fluitans TaxID=41844 RepID=A0ABD1ZF79_9MARC
MYGQEDLWTDERQGKYVYEIVSGPPEADIADLHISQLCQLPSSLQATSWHLEEAIQLYFAGGSEAVGGTVASAAAVPSPSVPESSSPTSLEPAPMVHAPER